MSVPSTYEKRGRGPTRIIFVVALGLAAAVLFLTGSVTAEGRNGVRDRNTVSPVLADPDSLGSRQPGAGKFLVAGSSIADPRFQETVVLLIDYSEKGATGLIVNRPTKVPLSEVLPAMPALKERTDVVNYGGPVEGNRILMLFRSEKRPEESKLVFNDVYVSTSKIALEQVIGMHKPEKELRLYAGYAGWFPGQLDSELLRGDWYIIDADVSSIFDKKPSELWRELYKRASAIQI